MLDHPEWLRLEGRTVVVLGAAAEMGPLRSLLRWGATVAAVDLPRPDLWTRLLGDTQRPGRPGARARDPGRRPTSPSAPGSTSSTTCRPPPAGSAALPGLARRRQLRLRRRRHQRAGQHRRRRPHRDGRARPRPDTAMSFLATPTDVFAVPGEAVDASAPGLRRPPHVEGAARAAAHPVAAAGCCAATTCPARTPASTTRVVLQQGPNYLLAKRLQRWRATSARAQGATVSFKIAPPTRTRSVVKNRGAGRGLRRRAPLRRRGVRPGHGQHADGGAARARPRAPARRARSTRGRTRRTPRRTAGCGARPTTRAAPWAWRPCSAPPPPAPDRPLPPLGAQVVAGHHFSTQLACGAPDPHLPASRRPRKPWLANRRPPVMMEA